MSLGKIFAEVENGIASGELNLKDYSVSQTTMEDVFLAFSERQNVDWVTIGVFYLLVMGSLSLVGI